MPSLTFVQRSSATARPGFNAPGSSEVVHQRLGYIREIEGDIEYMISRESWKALMAGRDARRTARELAGPAEFSNTTWKGDQTPRSVCPAISNSQRVYVVRHAALFADGGEDA